MNAIKPAETGWLEIHSNDPNADSLLSISCQRSYFSLKHQLKRFI